MIGALLSAFLFASSAIAATSSMGGSGVQNVPGSTMTISISFASAVQTFAATGNGTTIAVLGAPMKSYAIMVVQTGGVTSWDCRVEGSLDNVNFTQILQHTNATGSGVIVFSGATISPTLYFRVRVAGLVLGLGTNITTTILGVQ